MWLKKGGYIVIDQTEALVAIDVNTGRFTGKKNQEETIFKTNMEAAREIARQLRLRDIGGIIVIDFIDMESESNKKRVLKELRTYLKRDRAKTKTFHVSDLGLVEMSRQRVRPSLYHFMSDKCAYCESTGHVLSLDSITNRIERMVRRVSHYTRSRDVRLQANPMVAVFMRETQWDRMRELMAATGVRLDLVEDARLHREEFRLLSVQTGRGPDAPGLGPQPNGASDHGERSDRGERQRCVGERSDRGRPAATVRAQRPQRKAVIVANASAGIEPEAASASYGPSAARGDERRRGRGTRGGAGARRPSGEPRPTAGRRRSRDESSALRSSPDRAPGAGVERGRRTRQWQSPGWQAAAR